MDSLAHRPVEEAIEVLAPYFKFGMRTALATSEAFPKLTADDQSLLQPLRKRGFHPEPAIWSDPTCDWSAYDLVVIRSCWDYHLRTAEFLQWIEALEARGTQVLNPPAMIRWNADKYYLRELETKGIRIVPTLWCEPGPHVTIGDELRKAGWDKAVIKPRISATAHRTEVVRTGQAETAQRLFEELRNGPGVMVQKFMDSIVTLGEWSLMFFAGKFSHAVLKTPKAGDFRVQHDFGGSERSAIPHAFVLDAATRTLQALDSTPFYARVDGVEVDGVKNDGQFLLMELELIEPALFLQSSPGAADRFVNAIARRIQT